MEQKWRTDCQRPWNGHEIVSIIDIDNPQDFDSPAFFLPMSLSSLQLYTL